MADEIIRILSIDGGGIRGIIPARLLQSIEESIGEPATALFHLIAGTSTGGILGCGLA
jgi:patatin-like phospholipase/acyl hydrolase